ncbi:hypothetical protein ACW95P_01125 [Candidatus Mycoplasma pogonae]
MHKYFWWLVKTYFKRYLNYLAILFYPVLILLVTIFLKTQWSKSIDVYDTLSFYILPILLVSNSLLNYGSIFNQIKKNTTETSVELLSFTSNQSRLKIYFNKLAVYLIINLIALLTASIFIFSSLAYALDGSFISEIFIIIFAYIVTSMVFSILFFGFFFLIDAYLMTKIKKRHNIFYLAINSTYIIAGITFPISIFVAPNASVNKLNELKLISNKNNLNLKNTDLFNNQNDVTNITLLEKPTLDSHDLKYNADDLVSFDKQVAVYNEAADLYKNWNIFNYFNLFNIFRKASYLELISDKYYQQHKNEKSYIGNYSFKKFYKQNEIQNFVNNLLKVKIQRSLNAPVEENYIKGFNKRVLSVNLVGFLYDWPDSKYLELYSLENYTINAEEKFKSDKIILDNLVAELINDVDLNQLEILINFETVKIIYEKLKLLFNKSQLEKWKKDYTFYILIKIALEKPSVLKTEYNEWVEDNIKKNNLIKLTTPKDFNDRNLDENEYQIHDLTKSLINNLIGNKEFIAKSNIVAFGFDEVNYHLWISVIVTLLSLLLVNGVAIYKYNKTDVA